MKGGDPQFDILDHHVMHKVIQGRHVMRGIVMQGPIPEVLIIIHLLLDEGISLCDLFLD